MKLDISELDGRLQAKLKEAADQLPFATSVALNSLAFDVRDVLKKYIARSLDNPINYTINSVLVDKSESKKDLSVGVYIREKSPRGTAPADYLLPLVEGKSRTTKAHERGLRSRSRSLMGRLRGRSLPSNLYFVPGSGLKVNKNGNITKGKAKKILEGVRRKGGKYYIRPSQDGKRLLVIERMTRGKEKIVLIGISPPRYSRRLHFHAEARTAFEKAYPAHLEAALDRVLPKGDR